MTTQTNPFPHRFDADKAHDPLITQDAINAMSARAQGVLMLLFSHFEGENRLSDEIILNGIDAVFHDISDMKAAMKAHFEAVKLTRDITNRSQLNPAGHDAGL